MRSWGHVAYVGGAIGAIRGRRGDGGGARDGRYAAGVPVLGLRKGQILVGDAARWRVAIGRRMKTISTSGSLKSVGTTAGSEVSILAVLMIVLPADRVTIVAALHRLRDQVLVSGAFRVLISSANGTVDVR